MSSDTKQAAELQWPLLLLVVSDYSSLQKAF